MMKFNSRGDTIIEVMFSMAIIGVVLAAAYATAAKNLQTSQLAKERTQASNIVQAQLEQLKIVDPDILANVLPTSSFCIDVQAANVVVDATDPDNCIESYYKKTITKVNNQYTLVVEWIPPGGSEANKANVTVYYSDYDFDVSGSNSLTIAEISSDSSGVTLSATIRNQTNIAQSGVVYGTSVNPRLGDGSSRTVPNPSTGSEFTVTVQSLNVSVDGIDPNITYYARTFVLTSSNQAIYSAPLSIRAAPATAPSITNLSESPGIFTANITGLINDGGGRMSSRTITYYRLNNGGNPINQNTITLSSNTINNTLSSLDPGVQYYYVVNVENNVAAASSEVRTFTTISTPPGTVNVGEFVDVSNGGRRSIYYLSNDSVTCRQARETARNSGGYLATIGSRAENDFVSTFAGTNIWIGFNDIAEEGRWVWDNNEFPVWQIGNTTPYTNWALGEPNNYLNGNPGEDCTVMNWRGQNGLWNDLPEVSDLYRARYVIEFEIN